MYARRARQSREAVFPYQKSLLVSSALIVALVLILGTLADPRSGQIRAPYWAWLALAVFPASVAAVFSIEYRMRNKRGVTCKRRSPESNLSAKC